MKKIKTAPRTMVKNPDRPVCPKHNSSMVFDRSDTTWKCGVDGCRVVARRKEENGKAISNPISDQISLEIISDEDGETYHLNLNRGQFRMDVTDYTEMVIDEQTNSVTLCLLFHDVRRVYL